MKSMYSTWVFVNLGAIFWIFETGPKRSLGTPEKLWVVSSEPHLSFQIGSNFKNFNENQRNPCTIVHVVPCMYLVLWPSPVASLKRPGHYQNTFDGS